MYMPAAIAKVTGIISRVVVCTCVCVSVYFVYLVMHGSVYAIRLCICTELSDLCSSVRAVMDYCCVCMCVSVCACV